MAFLFSKTIQFLLLSCMVSILHTSMALNSVCTSVNTTNTTFQTNLNLLLTSLSSNVALTGFYNTSTGENPNHVYGLAQCVGYVSRTACVECINMAIQHIHQYRPAAIGGIVFGDECILRYSHEFFFSIVDNSTDGYELDGKNVSDPVRFTPFLEEMLSKLSRQAAFDPSGSMFAAGDVKFTSSEKVHAMVLCTRDLSANDCNKCLQDIIEDTLRCCPFSQTVRFFSNSCNLQYMVLDSDASSGGRPAPSSSDASSGGRPAPSSSTITANAIYFKVFILLMTLALLAN